MRKGAKAVVAALKERTIKKDGPSQDARQTNPLLPGYDFDIRLVAGLTPIERNGPLDFFIDRPEGMKGFIVNMTVEGHGIVYDGEQSLICGPGDLLLFPAGVPHYYGRAPGHEFWHHRWVYFQPRAYWQQWLEWPRKIDAIGHLSLANEAKQDEFQRLFEQIEQIHCRSTVLAENMCLNLLERLLLRCAEESSVNDAQALDPRIRRACHLLHEHLSEDWSVPELARAICLSPSRLEHLFRTQMGMTIVRWREDQRLIRARQLLQVTQSPISIIAASVGYDDQLYFSRVFRKRTGMSPSAFRKMSVGDTEAS